MLGSPTNATGSQPKNKALIAAASEKQPTDAEEAKRYRRLKDASGRTWDKLAGAHITGQLDVAIDHLGDDE